MSAPLTFFEEFTIDVAGHVMTVLQNDGVRRHLRFGAPGSSNQQFDILTWPGHLCYTGDMGTYVFARIEDMFAFFRRRPRGAESVNLGYWEEKVLAVDRDGVRTYDADLFRAQIKEWFDALDFENDQVRAEAWQSVRAEVLTYADDGRHRAVQAALEFEHAGELLFQDFYEVRVDVYTGRFVWCGYALQWAIEQYDQANAAPAEPVPAGVA